MSSSLLGEYAPFVWHADREHYDCESPVHMSNRLLSAGTPADACCIHVSEQTSYHIGHSSCSFGHECPGSAVEVKNRRGQITMTATRSCRSYSLPVWVDWVLKTAFRLLGSCCSLWRGSRSPRSWCYHDPPNSSPEVCRDDGEIRAYGDTKSWVAPSHIPPRDSRRDLYTVAPLEKDKLSFLLTSFLWVTPHNLIAMLTQLF